MRLRLGSASVGAVLAATLVAGTAGGTPSASANLDVDLLVGQTRADTRIVPKGQTLIVKSLRFKAGIAVESIGPDVVQTVRARFHLPEGLRWGTDLPDPSEGCTSTATTADCLSPIALDVNDLNSRATGWAWDVIADGPGDYALSGEVVESSASDPDLSDNSAAVTAQVTQPVSIGGVKLSPAKPKAGSVVTARIAVTAGGDAITPTAVLCAGKAGGKAVRSAAGFSAGRATCKFRPASNAKGTVLRGSVTVAAGGVRATRTFAVRLR
jgi:hypothetical protein